MPSSARLVQSLGPGMAPAAGSGPAVNGSASRRAPHRGGALPDADGRFWILRFGF